MPKEYNFKYIYNPPKGTEVINNISKIDKLKSNICSKIMYLNSVQMQLSNNFCFFKEKSVDENNDIHSMASVKLNNSIT